jgi:hypothetical protein
MFSERLPVVALQHREFLAATGAVTAAGAARPLPTHAVC